MVDVHNAETRSRNMAAVKGRHTRPELLIRKALHKAGLRYRLHRKDLPGKPDLVFARYRAVVFVHGCFWHQHDCQLFRWPTTNQDFWRAKIGRNVVNDEKAIQSLNDTDWRVAIVWECALKGRAKLNFPHAMQSLIAWIKGDQRTITIRGR